MDWQHLSCFEKLIIFGGTFDPIHNGHLAIADILYKQLHAPVIFMPTGGIIPYKTGTGTTDAARVAMLKLALKPHSQFILDTSELECQQYSCSHTILRSIRTELGPQIPIYFFIGADSLITLDTWDYWQELFNLTNFIVAIRPGYSWNKMSPQLHHEFNLRKTLDLSTANIGCGKIYMLDSPTFDVSSTQIRRAIRNDQNIQGMVSSDVEQYIRRHNLYQ